MADGDKWRKKKERVDISWQSDLQLSTNVTVQKASYTREKQVWTFFIFFLIKIEVFLPIKRASSNLLIFLKDETWELFIFFSEKLYRRRNMFGDISESEQFFILFKTLGSRDNMVFYVSIKQEKNQVLRQCQDTSIKHDWLDTFITLKLMRKSFHASFSNKRQGLIFFLHSSPPILQFLLQHSAPVY